MPFEIPKFGFITAYSLPPYIKENPAKPKSNLL